MAQLFRQGRLQATQEQGARLDQHNEINKILAITKDSRVELARSFKELLHTELALGMTRYDCRYGSLGEGHEKLTEAQQYFQSIKEMYVRGCELSNYEVLALRAEADLLDAEENLKLADTRQKELRAKADLLAATNKIRDALVNSEDILRQLDEFNKVRLELKDKVKAQYPGGIEQAAPDMWEAVLKYRMARQNIGHNEMLHHVPLDKYKKAKLAIEYNKPELAFWLSQQEPKEFEKLLVETNINNKRVEFIK